MVESNACLGSSTVGLSFELISFAFEPAFFPIGIFLLIEATWERGCQYQAREEKMKA